MVKLMFFCKRRTDISHERYAELLLGGHAPIALKHHPTLRRYVINIVEETPAGWEEYDSVGELHFESLEDYRERLYDSPEGEKIVHEDVARFMGGAHSYATTEHVQRSVPTGVALGQRTPLRKMVCPIKRRDGMEHDAFVSHWLEQHVPLALAHHPGLVKYVTNVVDQRLSPEGEEWDGVGELYFAADQELAPQLFGSADDERTIREDMDRFIGRTAAYRVAEHVQRE